VGNRIARKHAEAEELDDRTEKVTLVEAEAQEAEVIKENTDGDDA